jgi:hypothetical protein
MTLPDEQRAKIRETYSVDHVVHKIDRRVAAAACERIAALEAARDALAGALTKMQKSCCLSGCYDCDEAAKTLDARAPGWRDR